MENNLPQLEKLMKRFYDSLPDGEAVETFHEYFTDMLTDLYHARIKALWKGEQS